MTSTLMASVARVLLTDASMTDPVTKRHTGSIFARSRFSAVAGILVAACVLSSAIACQSGYRPLRESVYPPDFTYVPKSRVKSSMWILAAEIHHLDELLRTAPDASNLRVQRDVQATLRRLSAAVEQIDRPGQTTQHPALNQHLQRFAERLVQAQRGAERTPPNYFQASALSGSCFLCHQSS